MAKTTGIPWTRSTRNFWSGCTKVSPGCDGCYAEAFQRFTRGKNPATGQATNWGPGAPRIQHLLNADRDVRKWDKSCRIERTMLGQKRKVEPKDGWKRPGYWPVFINSNSDTFDNEVPQLWRDVLFTTIDDCEALTFFLVTKRIGNVAGMVPGRWMRDGFPKNVRLIITVVNQEEADRDIPKLITLPCKNGVSNEPAIGPVDWKKWLEDGHPTRADIDHPTLGLHYLRYGTPRIHWLIVGGESDQGGHKARPFDIAWAHSTVEQCKAAGVPVFVKQFGSLPYDRARQSCDPTDCMVHGVSMLNLKDRAGADPAEWPEDLRIREFPE